jgi:hypothetical protein
MIAGNPDHGSPGAFGRHPERVTLALHHEDRDLDGLQLGKATFGRVIPPARGMQRKGQAEDG